MKFWKITEAIRSFSTNHRNSWTSNNSCKELRNANGDQSSSDKVKKSKKHARHKAIRGILPEENSGMIVVELIKKENCSLGVVVSGGCDTGKSPRIAVLRQGSWAQRSDVLAVGDYILAINGTPTLNMRHRQIVKILNKSLSKFEFHIEFELPKLCCDTNKVEKKIMQVSLVKEHSSYGFTLRGGWNRNLAKSCPLVIVQVCMGGPAYEEGTIQVNDRLVAIDGLKMTEKSLAEAQTALHEHVGEVVLTIEYDIRRNNYFPLATGPLLVEIEKPINSLMGIGLNYAGNCNGIIIESIKQGSIAERCGALHVGDYLMAINGKRTAEMLPEDASRLIRTLPGEKISFEVLPTARFFFVTKLI